ncbi:nuclear transport factor 2 family protein [uncultured Brevundimonas sp.]|uniref:YybH family protein n=1 Tax=uncultured Brevundimonas sp. TaxID=213418 RepID=UPI0030ECB12B|tara:strand:+ start:744 stop:1178 length:435 start_codon:yes stop_codon:yes gene_type:complete
MSHRLAAVGLALGLLLAGPAAAGPVEDAAAGFEAQMAAWNRGDIEGALALYLDTPDIVWVSRAGVERGFDSFAAAMRTEFAGHPEIMGTYSGEVLDALPLGPDHVALVLRWQITRDGTRLYGGVSTQVWQRIDGHWRIVLEHAG